MKRFRRTLFVLSLVLLAFAAGRFYPVLRRPPLVLGQDAVVTNVDPAQVSVSYSNSDGYIDVAPVGEFDTLFIFYPGGLVRPQAYEWLGVALAPSGVRTLDSNFSLRLGGNCAQPG